MKAQMINLLPVEKIRLLNVERINTLVTLVAVVVGATLAGIVVVSLLLLGGVAAARAALDGQISDSNAQIAQLDKLPDESGKLEDRARLLQAQLSTIKTILDAKTKVQFARALERIGQVVPSDVSFNQASITGETMTVTGRARSYAAIGRFSEALKQNGSSINQTKDRQPYFSDVVIQAANFNNGTADVTYSLAFKFGQETFDAGN